MSVLTLNTAHEGASNTREGTRGERTSTIAKRELSAKLRKPNVQSECHFLFQTKNDLNSEKREIHASLGRCPSIVRPVFPMLVFQLISKQQKRTWTTHSTVPWWKFRPRKKIFRPLLTDPPNPVPVPPPPHPPLVRGRPPPSLYFQYKPTIPGHLLARLFPFPQPQTDKDKQYPKCQPRRSQRLRMVL